ncbi:MAG: ribbon-helix-helix domain-containing protein [Candidatus Bathyarchaeota archaeon]|nr:ribbon-helix-helix domain-containing protein [Candidatus Bathyarchaeota archaeon]
MPMDKYRGISLQRELVDIIEEYIKAHPEMGYKSLADFVTDAVREKCSELRIIAATSELPQLEHFNISENGVRILDRSLKNGTSRGRIIDVYFKPKGIWCENCQADNCRHIQFALTVPKIREITEKKRVEGWKLPETE